MAVELQHWSIIIPIENINKCKSLGGFEKFIESQKDRIGYDVWYDEYLYRYRVPFDNIKIIKIFKFWENEGLQLCNRVAGDSASYTFTDFCLTHDYGISLFMCNWLKVDTDVPCVWLKGKPRGELRGSNRKKSKVTSESTIGEGHYFDLFERLYKFHQDKDISWAPMLFKVFTFRRALGGYKPAEWNPPKNYLMYLVYSIFYFITVILFPPVINLIMMVLPKFNANKSLEIFDLIKLDKGYTLDYQCQGSNPVVHTRRKLQFLDLFSFKPKDVSDVLGPFSFENYSFERSPEGFFQFAVFSKTVQQIFLFRQQLESDLVFVYSKSQIEDILKGKLKEELILARNSNPWSDWKAREKIAEPELSALFQNRKSDDDISIYLGPIREENCFYNQITGELIQGYWTSLEELQALFNASLDPQVTIMENGYGIVRILTFSKWGGFEYCRYAIQWPISVEEIYEEQETVLSYSCGIQF